MARKHWLITGVSSGLGKQLAETVMSHGDIVVGTFRDADSAVRFSNDFPGRGYGVVMDVTSSEQVEAGVKQAVAVVERLDVLVNNAGSGIFGAIEELALDDFRRQIEVNLIGALAVTQAALPVMRAQRVGLIFQMSSVSGIKALPGLGAYAASKFALEGCSEALAAEVAHLGLKVVIVEPGPFRTQWAENTGGDDRRIIADYEPSAHRQIERLRAMSGAQPGDPAKAAEVIFQMSREANPPLRLPLGQIAIDRVRQKQIEVEADIAAWAFKTANTSFE